MIKKRLTSRKGYTLVELLVAVSLFATVSIIAINVFINIIRIQGQLNLENNIYEDSRFMMERLSRSIRNNAIDYEEYFNKAIDSSHQYGDFYGCYAAQFYNPGIGKTTGILDITSSSGGVGALCNDSKLYVGQECVVFKPSIDLNTGKYPYLGAVSGALASNAFCNAYPWVKTCTVKNQNTVEELYLINKDGTRKTLFARKQLTSGTPPQYGLAMVEKVGEDTNKDGITETWLGCDGGTNDFCCDSDVKNYDCSGLTKLEDSLSNNLPYNGFVAISPQRTTVTRLTFRISPGEDPRKAFAEPGAVSQPKVTITLEAQPSDDQLAVYGGLTGDNIPKIVLQTTISSRIQSEVKSYRGVDTYTIGTATDYCKLADRL